MEEAGKSVDGDQQDEVVAVDTSIENGKTDDFIWDALEGFF